MHTDLITLAGLVLVVVSIISNAYWQDAVRWHSAMKRAKIKGNITAEKFARGSSWRALCLFKFGTALGFLVTSAITYAMYESFGGQQNYEYVNIPDKVIFLCWCLLTLPSFFLLLHQSIFLQSDIQMILMSYDSQRSSSQLCCQK